MANPRDTVILPCRHLCICNGCAETLRYKLNNCPICRSPFKALLKLKAIRAQADHSGALSGSLSNRMRQQPATLIEALNGPYHPPSLDGRALPGKDAELGAVPVIGSNPPQTQYGLSERATAQNLQTLRRHSASDNEEEQIELEDIAPFRPGYADDRFGTTLPATKHGTVCSNRTGSRSDEATDSELQPLSRSSSSVKRDYSDETAGQAGDPHHATLITTVP
ncbi:E3 ubiquitin-protein ligase MGRN1 [Aphelenchoides avenae]|nr:E3 ubiquitin-protein ligase MGRN1 [Aphelenchus avenae]